MEGLMTWHTRVTSSKSCSHKILQFGYLAAGGAHFQQVKFTDASKGLDKGHVQYEAPQSSFLF